MSFADTVVLFVLALLLFGPKKLPGIARQIGKALGEFRRASNEFKAQIEAEISQLEYEERRKKREEEQKQLQEQSILPPAPPAGSVESSRYSPPTAEQLRGAGAPPEVDPSATPDTTNA